MNYLNTLNVVLFINYLRLRSTAARFQVQTVDELLNKIAPLFKDTGFNTKKKFHFEKTIQSLRACELIKKEGFKTDEGLKAIVDLA